MSPKELLYIEDALGHTQYLMTQCRTAASQLTDPVLRQQAQQQHHRLGPGQRLLQRQVGRAVGQRALPLQQAQMMTKHQELFAQFYQLV